MAKTKQDGFPFSAIPRGKHLSLLWLACALAVIGIAPARAQTTEIVLHSFAPHPPKGSFPFAGVIRDSAGNLYGTTNHGGAANAGVVYKVDTAGHQTVLYSFGGGADGSYPSGVIGDSAGNFYGTTYEGGTPGGGTVYELDAAGHKTVLYSFTAAADGFGPSGGLIRDSGGNLYGTTGLGGTAETGVVFELDTTGHFTVLYTFTGGADGDSPSSGVIRDSAGNFYGTTSRGGASGQGVRVKTGYGDPRDGAVQLHGRGRRGIPPEQSDERFGRQPLRDDVLRRRSEHGRRVQAGYGRSGDCAAQLQGWRRWRYPRSGGDTRLGRQPLRNRFNRRERGRGHGVPVGCVRPGDGAVQLSGRGRWGVPVCRGDRRLGRQPLRDHNLRRRVD